MLNNAYLIEKSGADTAENEQHSAEILPTDALWRHEVVRLRGPLRRLRRVAHDGHVVHDGRQERRRAHREPCRPLFQAHEEHLTILAETWPNVAGISEVKI